MERMSTVSWKKPKSARDFLYEIDDVPKADDVSPKAVSSTMSLSEMTTRLYTLENRRRILRTKMRSFHEGLKDEIDHNQRVASSFNRSTSESSTLYADYEEESEEKRDHCEPQPETEQLQTNNSVDNNDDGDDDGSLSVVKIENEQLRNEIEQLKAALKQKDDDESLIVVKIENEQLRNEIEQLKAALKQKDDDESLSVVKIENQQLRKEIEQLKAALKQKHEELEVVRVATTVMMEETEAKEKNAADDSAAKNSRLRDQLGQALEERDVARQEAVSLSIKLAENKAYVDELEDRLEVLQEMIEENKKKQGMLMPRSFPQRWWGAATATCKESKRQNEKERYLDGVPARLSMSSSTESSADMSDLSWNSEDTVGSPAGRARRRDTNAVMHTM